MTHLFLTALQAGKSKIKAPVDLVSGKNPPLVVDCQLLIVSSHGGKRAQEVTRSLVYGTNAVHEGPTS